MQLQHFQEFAVLSQLKLLQKKSLKKKKEKWAKLKYTVKSASFKGK